MVHPTSATKTTRVGYMVGKDGTKVRVARQASNKAIDTAPKQAKGKGDK